ncbi:MAG: cytochrome c peroxidase [Pseudomonadota bacterium]|nr:cytochrome c peroxidase [Pseudomonadota bacterium]
MLITLLGFPGWMFAGDDPAREISPCGQNAGDPVLWRIVQDFARDDAPGPASGALAGLGRDLFFDRRLSRNGKVACATCHIPELGFTDGKPVGEGLSKVDKNTPTLLNVYRGGWFFWDGRSDSLASQALQPLENPLEHGFTRTGVVNLVVRHYRDAYEAAFGPLPQRLIEAEPLPAAMPEPVRIGMSANMLDYGLATLGDLAVFNGIVAGAWSGGVQPSAFVLGHYVNRPLTDDGRALSSAWDALPARDRHAVERVYVNIGKAIAAFERGLVANDSPFDRFARGWQADCEPGSAFVDGFGARELAGLRLFVGSGRCLLCHNGPAFSDGQFHNIGLPDRAERPDYGRTAGARRVLANPFNCRSPFYRGDTGITGSETCREAAYLDTENPEMLGAFKTPTLRNLALTSPYAHDGRFTSLHEMLDHYNTLDATPAIGHTEETLKPLNFGDRELGDLEAFLMSLTSPAAASFTQR